MSHTELMIANNVAVATVASLELLSFLLKLYIMFGHSGVLVTSLFYSSQHPILYIERRCRGTNITRKSSAGTSTNDVVPYAVFMLMHQIAACVSRFRERGTMHKAKRHQCIIAT